MRTKDLIDQLASKSPILSAHLLRNGILTALAIGIAASLALMMALFGRPVMPASAAAAPVWWLTVLLCLAILAVGAFALLRAARPEPLSMRLALAPLGVWFTLIVVGLLAWLKFGPAAPTSLPMTSGWAQCLQCIPLFAVPSASILFVALRSAAPSAPWRTGALVGIVAGATGALAFSCCGSIGFSAQMAFWYAAAIALCAAIGAFGGRALLKW